MLIKPKSWERHGLKPWIEAAKKRLHHNVLAIALANKLARIAWSVLARGRPTPSRYRDQRQPARLASRPSATTRADGRPPPTRSRRRRFALDFPRKNLNYHPTRRRNLGNRFSALPRKSCWRRPSSKTDVSNAEFAVARMNSGGTWG